MKLRLFMPLGTVILMLMVSAAWAAPPSPDATYVGSQTCGACHPQNHDQWQRSIHSKMIQDAVANPDAVVADFTDPDRPYDLDAVRFTLGIRYRQRYITQTDEDLIVLDGQWNIKKQRWDPAGGGKSWTDSCAGCHSTGYDPETKTYAEVAIGCEACHGPGSEHIAMGGGKDAAIVASADVQICGQCHTRGSSPDGAHGYPVGYRPGGELEGKFNHTMYSPGDFNPVEWWPDGHSKKHRQQYPEWLKSGHGNALEGLKTNKYARDSCLSCHSADYRLAPDDAKPTIETARYGLTCVTCHSSHSDSTQLFDSLLRAESYDLCAECHNGGGEKTAGSTVHHPMKEMFEGVGAIGVEAEPSPHSAASASGGPICVSCHMVSTAKSADVGDVASHNWSVVDPGQAADGQPDSCTTCHVGSRNSMQALIEERQGVVKRQLAALQAALDAATDTESDAYKTAYTNMTFVRSEGSYGIHNYYYARTILEKAFMDLTGGDINAVESSFSVALGKGLNMISLPLKPAADYTARGFLNLLGATIVIRLDEQRQHFEGFAASHDGDGFAIEGGKGYIVNLLDPGSVTFTGAAWQDAAAPVVAGDSTGWALMVSGRLIDPQTQTPVVGPYTVVLENMRTGTVVSDSVGSAGIGKYAPVWADLSRRPVALEGDVLRLTVYDSEDAVVSGPYRHQVTRDELSRAIVRLDAVLGQVIPEHTVLAQNYPNPFNPETWIPYQLAEPGDVMIRISDTTGRLIRRLDLGHKQAGVYLQPAQAAYWDGTNDVGEPVASGTYFYTIQLGDFTSTRKMVILK